MDTAATSAAPLDDGVDLVGALMARPPAQAPPAQAPPVLDWPGLIQLSRRESEIVALIARGLSNQEIADQLNLSINSIKTYVRAAYRKMGVTSRTRAVLWGLDHGL